MMNIFRSITENEAGVLKANLSEPEFDGLRNDPFHFSDTNIKVSRYLVSSSSYYVIQLLSKSYLLPITQEASECSSSTCIVPKDDASFFLFHERFPSGQTLYPKSHISFLATQCNVEKPRFLTSSFVKAFPSSVDHFCSDRMYFCIFFALILALFNRYLSFASDEFFFHHLFLDSNLLLILRSSKRCFP